MKKVYNGSKLVRKVGLGVVLSSAVFALASCNQSKNVFDGIDSDHVYAKITKDGTTYQITNQELFNELLWSGTSDVETKVARVIAHAQLEAVTKAIEDSSSEEYTKNTSLRKLMLLNQMMLTF